MVKDIDTWRHQERQILLWLLLLSSLTGIVIWYVQQLSAAPLGEWAAITTRWISFFTNLTNALIVVMAAALLYGRGRLHRWFHSPVIQSAFCLYIAFVGLAYWSLLAGSYDPETVLGWTAELTAHTLSPILGVIYWVRVIPRGYLQWRHALLWLAYPLAYLVYWLIRGPLVGYYPYFFIDVNALGYGGVAVWSTILLVVLVALGTLMWAVDRWQIRRFSVQISGQS